MHDYLSKAKSSNFHYFVLSRGTVRGTPWPIVIAGDKSRLLHSLIYYTLATQNMYEYLVEIWNKQSRFEELVARITVTLSIFNFSTWFFAQIVGNRETQLSSPFLGPGDNFSKSYDENQISTRHVHVNIGEKQYKYFEILYEILYENLFRTMRPRSARARAKRPFQVSWTCRYILCNVGTTCALSSLESRQAAGASQGASIVGPCVPGSPIYHAELPRSALLTSKAFFPYFYSKGY